MADLGNYDDKLIKDDELQSQNSIGSFTTTAGTSGVVSGTQGAGSVSTAGIGSGGTGGWTNIQAYLNANKADNGSSTLLNNKAGGQYDKEIGNLNTQAGEAKTQAQSEANKIKDTNDNSKTWVNQAANAYSWSGPQSQDYKEGIGKVQSAMNGTYQGPNNFAYSQSGDFQKTGAALKDDKAMGNYMNDIYKEKAGGQLTSGQGALQTQLDVNNESLANARKALLDKYAGFTDLSDKAVTDTDAAINKARTDYGNNQEALKFNLQNLAKDYDSQIGKAEADAREAYNKEYSNGQSGRAGYGNYFENNILNPHKGVDVGNYGYRDNLNTLRNQGLTGNNLTWEQLQKEQNTGDILSGTYGLGWDPDRRDYLPSNLLSDNGAALNSFYSAQDAKYANTADSEERNWNTIMDILGNANRKEKGFKVRG